MANQIPPIPQRTQGMDPTAELQQWAQWRQAVEQAGLTDKLTGDEARYFNGPSPRPGNAAFDQAYGTDLFSPEAGQTYVNAKTHFDLKSGQVEKNQSGWDLPETKLITALAAGLGGVAAAPAIAGLFGGEAAAGGGGALGADAAGVGATSGLASGAGIGTAVAAPTLADISGVVAGDVTGGLGGSTLGKVTGLLGKGGGLSDILGAAGSGVGQAANAAAGNREAKGNLALRAQSQFENEMMARAKEEQSQRNDALKQGYYANYVQNRKPGPFNTAGITPYGSDTLSTANALAQQSKAKLANAPQYDTNGMPKLQTSDQFVDEYGNPSTMEKVGNWLSPALTTLGKVSRYF